jgi:hypothetical protein
MGTLASGGGIPDVHESMQNQEHGGEEDGRPSLIGCGREPKERQRRDEVGTANVGDEMAVGGPGGRDAGMAEYQ